MKVKINTHGNALPEVHGEWIDLCTAEDVTLDFLEYKIISLGVSIEIPGGLLRARRSPFLDLRQVGRPAGEQHGRDRE